MTFGRFEVYRCAFCGKMKPSPYVIHNDPCECTKAEMKSKRHEEIKALLLTIISKLNSLSGENKTMALDISALQAAVAAETSVENSAVALIGGLSAQIKDLLAASTNTVDPAALKALVDQMDASQAALAAAVAANTPAAPAPPAPTA